MSARQVYLASLTPDQQEWHAAWRGQKAVVETVAQALDACGIEFRGQIA
ncbi:hypothetical protein [Leisingera sp. ANG-M1]|nr:hypothetical protein [Leisingera sp. ANG-M1]